MDARSFTPSERPPVRFVDDADSAYAATRAREAHDFWHVLFACPTSVAGELALKAVEFVQTGLPAAGAAVLGAAWRLDRDQRAWLASAGVPWALRSGSRAADLLTLAYEDALQEGLDVVRARWRIVPLGVPPPSPPSTGKKKAKAGEGEGGGG
jgi:ubiquinone biosynthesis protein COQ4